MRRSGVAFPSDLAAPDLVDADAEPPAGDGLVCETRIGTGCRADVGVFAAAEAKRLPLARPRLIVCLWPVRSADGEKSEDDWAAGVVRLEDRALASEEAVGLDGVPVSCGRSGAGVDGP